MILLLIIMASRTKFLIVPAAPPLRPERHVRIPSPQYALGSLMPWRSGCHDVHAINDSL
jgi:hypothetical protein